MVMATSLGLVLFGTVSGTTEAFLHGFSFFVFRSAGTGATLSNGPKEDQGPGQPDAPGAHHHATPRPHHQKHHHHRPPDGRTGGSSD
jgi:hypothetical protein